MHKKLIWKNRRIMVKHVCFTLTWHRLFFFLFVLHVELLMALFEHICNFMVVVSIQNTSKFIKKLFLSLFFNSDCVCSKIAQSVFFFRLPVATSNSRPSEQYNRYLNRALKTNNGRLLWHKINGMVSNDYLKQHCSFVASMEKRNHLDYLNIYFFHFARSPVKRFFLPFGFSCFFLRYLLFSFFFSFSFVFFCNFWKVYS